MVVDGQGTDDGCLTNGDRWSMVKERRSMRSFQKVTVEAYKKVTVLVRLLSSCLVLGVPNGVEGKVSCSGRCRCHGWSMIDG